MVVAKTDFYIHLFARTLLELLLILWSTAAPQDVYLLLYKEAYLLQ